MVPDLKRLINYKFIPDGQYITAYIIWGEDKPPKLHLNEVCHSSMIHSGPGYDNLITKTGEQTPHNMRYLKGLVEGPFQHYAEYVVFDFDLGYAHISQLDKWPANVLYNFVIATRMYVEDADIVDAALLKLPEDQNAIQAVIEYEREHPAKNCNHLWYDGTDTHWVIGHSSNIDDILAGSMNEEAVSKKSYKEDPRGCIPCNVIWRK